MDVSKGEHSPLFHPHFLTLLCQAAPFIPFRKISGSPKLPVTPVMVDPSHLSPEIKAMGSMANSSSKSTQPPPLTKNGCKCLFADTGVPGLAGSWPSISEAPTQSVCKDMPGCASSSRPSRSPHGLDSRPSSRGRRAALWAAGFQGKVTDHLSEELMCLPHTASILCLSRLAHQESGFEPRSIMCRCDICSCNRSPPAGVADVSVE